MIQFPINNRFSGEVQFTATIHCSEGAPPSFKVGLAVKWAVENGVSLRGADLSGVNLRGADLDGADLDGVNLRGANLDGVSLRYASLSDADLDDANLDGANLDGANLSYASFSYANLRGANLDGVSLRGANLSYASFSYANLRGANLSDANLDGTTMNGPYGRSISTDIWTVVYTHDFMQIGCQGHAIADWWKFDDGQIAEMDGRALEWWRRWKPILQQIIETAPCRPTGAKEE